MRNHGARRLFLSFFWYPPLALLGPRTQELRRHVKATKPRIARVQGAEARGLRMGRFGTDPVCLRFFETKKGARRQWPLSSYYLVRVRQTDR